MPLSHWRLKINCWKSAKLEGRRETWVESKRAIRLSVCRQLILKLLVSLIGSVVLMCRKLQVASERGSKSAVKQLVRRCLIAFCAVTTLFLMFPIDTFSTINIQFIFVLYLHSRLSVESDRVRAPSKLAINRLTPNNLLYRMFYFSFAPFFSLPTRLGLRGDVACKYSSNESSWSRCWKTCFKFYCLIRSQRAECGLE